MTAVAAPGMSFPTPPALHDGVVSLRPWRPDDACVLAAAWADPDITRWMAVPSRRGIADAERWIRGCEARRRRGLALDLVVTAASDPRSQPRGEVGVVPVDDDCVQLGWWIGAQHRHTGLASAAVSLVADWCREVLDRRPIAVIDPTNAASLRVAERAGVAIRRSRR